MKKLSKLKLNDFHQMSNLEMKNVVGGSGTIYQDACDGKALCDPCSYVNGGNQLVSGTCSQSAGNPKRYCSTNRCHQ